MLFKIKVYNSNIDYCNNHFKHDIIETDDIYINESIILEKYINYINESETYFKNNIELSLNNKNSFRDKIRGEDYYFYIIKNIDIPKL